MTKRCLDDSVLQAYLDGELSRERAAEAAAHLAACADCAAALAVAEQGTSLFAAAFAPDESVGVPSEVLRSRINAAVARLESQAEPNSSRERGRDFGGLFASLAGLFSFTPQRAAAFASLLAVVALAAVYFTAQGPRQTPAQSEAGRQVAEVTQAPARPSVMTATPEAVGPAPAPAPDKVKTTATTTAAPVKVNYRPRRAAGGNGGAKPAAAPKEEALPGEKDYQTAIASLEKTIKLGGDESLRPALRAEYERNLALLDNAISQTRQVAARNPKDETVVGFLMAAYQSKVELLTKVADQAQVSALGR
ncbi:MAG TPA: zf-HC2 domain-containing protein [Pyrinomonadaceae bacterium]|jgi:anti-sigma factor RsiW